MRFLVGLCLFTWTLTACDSQSSSKKITPISETLPNPAPIQPTGPIDDPAAKIPQPNLDSPNGNTLNLGMSTTRADFLARLGRDLAAKAGRFKNSAEEFQAKVSNFCEQLTPDSQASAQQGWRNMMSLWQHFEVFQLGPLSENARTLKSSIYVWPDPANYCEIDEESLKAKQNSAYALARNLNRRGLMATEYLLFDSALKSSCDPNTAKANRWEALNSEQKWQARCAYLKPVAADLLVQGEKLSLAWGTPEDNYISRRLGNAAEEQNLIQALYEDLFFFDIKVKNNKLAAPAGHDVKYCSSSPVPCLDKEEFPYSHFSRVALDINTKAFVDLIFGPDQGQRQGGFSALIRAEGRADVADRSEVLASRLLSLVQEDADASLQELIQKQALENCELSTTSWLCRMRSGIKAFAFDLKNEYQAILNVKIPEAAAGDND
jgi:hypothetical protein